MLRQIAILFTLFVLLSINTRSKGIIDKNITAMNSLSDSPSHKQVCLIDKFFVPSSAINEFAERMSYNRQFIIHLPGFIEDKVYEQVDEQGNFNIITIAIWESQEKIDQARNSVQSEYKRIGFNLPEFISRLNIKMERGIYKPWVSDHQLHGQ